MSSDRWQLLRDLFDRVAELDAAERAAVLDRECAGDVALRRELEELLEGAEREDDFLRPPSEDARTGGEPRVGRFVLERELGGRTGRVHLAREEPGGRPVVLRLLPIDPADVEALERLRVEAAALAALADPPEDTLAAVLEVGVCADPGEPGAAAVYLVSEHVEGEPLVAGAEARALGAEARRALLGTVTAAVEQAQRAGVHHGNLSSANVLLDAEGAARIVDYGVARLAAPAPESARAVERDAAALADLATALGVAP